MEQITKSKKFLPVENHRNVIKRGGNNWYYYTDRYSKKLLSILSWVWIREPLMINKKNIWLYFDKIKYSHQIIEGAKSSNTLDPTINTIPPWIKTICVYWNKYRSEQRGYLVVTHAPWVTLHEQFHILWQQNNISQKASLTTFVLYLKWELKKIWINAIDFSMKNIRVSESTAQKIERQLCWWDKIILSHEDSVYVNIDPDEWDFDQCISKIDR